MAHLRRLVLGGQFDLDVSAFEGIDLEQDHLWMVEASEALRLASGRASSESLCCCRVTRARLLV
jgi:hypothetical protein